MYVPLECLDLVSSWRFRYRDKPDTQTDRKERKEREGKEGKKGKK